jgi:3-hydroxybutyryl-CoA dehydrogenase
MAEQVGVVGGGLMGSGIAYTVALKSGAKVSIMEVNDELLNRCRQRMDKLIQTGVQRGAITAEQAAELGGRIRYVTDLKSLGPAQIVVEAVFEDVPVKQKVFKELDQLYSPETILASNTSGLSITDIASVTSHPERVIGTHFFNPVPVMKLVELVCGEKTADGTVATARKFCEELGKEAVVSSDRPGFITTRVGQAYMCEALRCLEEKVGTVEDIDTGVRLAYNFPMGPFQLLDLIGLDTELKIMDSLVRDLGPRFDPGPIMRQMVAENRLGRKSGRGFFEYPAKPEKSAKS